MYPATLGAEIHEALGVYVYALEDPRSGRIFYVGRGVNDRVLQHARDALTGDDAGAKLERIREIKSQRLEPVAWILRRRLGSRSSAAEMESLAIDILSRWHERLLNEMRGAGTADGIRTLEGILADHRAEPLRTERAAVVVNIGRTWVEGITPDHLWDAARKWWMCRPEDRRPKPDLLLAEAGNIIRGAWTVRVPPHRREVRWSDLDERRRAFFSTADTFQPFVASCFDGIPDGDWDILVGRHTRPPVLPRSYGSAFRYLNC